MVNRQCVMFARSTNCSFSHPFQRELDVLATYFKVWLSFYCPHEASQNQRPTWTLYFTVSGQLSLPIPWRTCQRAGTVDHPASHVEPRVVEVSDSVVPASSYRLNCPQISGLVNTDRATTQAHYVFARNAPASAQSVGRTQPVHILRHSRSHSFGNIPAESYV